jgi:hypothetical protein
MAESVQGGRIRLPAERLKTGKSGLDSPCAPSRNLNAVHFHLLLRFPLIKNCDARQEMFKQGARQMSLHTSMPKRSARSRPGMRTLCDSRVLAPLATAFLRVACSRSGGSPAAKPRDLPSPGHELRDGCRAGSAYR